MLTKTVGFASATAKASGHVEVQIDTVISDDGVEVARSAHNHVLAPGDDLTNQDPAVVAIAQAHWTTERVEAYQTIVKAQAAEMAARQVAIAEAAKG